MARKEIKQVVIQCDKHGEQCPKEEKPSGEALKFIHPFTGQPTATDLCPTERTKVEKLLKTFDGLGYIDDDAVAMAEDAKSEREEAHRREIIAACQAVRDEFTKADREKEAEKRRKALSALITAWAIKHELREAGARGKNTDHVIGQFYTANPFMRAWNVGDDDPTLNPPIELATLESEEDKAKMESGEKALAEAAGLVETDEQRAAKAKALEVANA